MTMKKWINDFKGYCKPLMSCLGFLRVENITLCSGNLDKSIFSNYTLKWPFPEVRRGLAGLLPLGESLELVSSHTVPCASLSPKPELIVWHLELCCDKLTLL